MLDRRILVFVPVAILIFCAQGCGQSGNTTLNLIGLGNGSEGEVTGGTEYCEAVADWNAQWAEFETAVLELVNEHRAAGADCGSGGSFAAAGPLSMNGELRCAARNHSMDMGTRDYFSHSSPEGEGPGERLNHAGYSPSTWGENIAWGYESPEAVVSGWMGSDGHCANIMNANFTQIGVGYFEGSLWTQAFGRP